jgi:hypothetical protein
MKPVENKAITAATATTCPLLLARLNMVQTNPPSDCAAINPLD